MVEKNEKGKVQGHRGSIIENLGHRKPVASLDSEGSRKRRRRQIVRLPNRGGNLQRGPTNKVQRLPQLRAE